MPRQQLVEQLLPAWKQTFRHFRSMTGDYYTKYGSSVGVTYPPDPANYPYCGDASNPINIKCLPTPERPLIDGALTHELGHVFTQGYPYIIDQNVETGANYLRDWLYDPRGGQAMGVHEYLRYEWQMLQSLSDLGPTTTWVQALGNDALMLAIKNHVGGWSVLADTMRQYSANYAGIQSYFPSDQRGQDFALSLVDHVPDPLTRETLMPMARIPSSSSPYASDGVPVGHRMSYSVSIR